MPSPQELEFIGAFKRGILRKKGFLNINGLKAHSFQINLLKHFNLARGASPRIHPAARRLINRVDYKSSCQEKPLKADNW